MTDSKKSHIEIAVGIVVLTIVVDVVLVRRLLDETLPVCCPYRGRCPGRTPWDRSRK
jgi:hypothetical protein